jgi:hypothetical protein
VSALGLMVGYFRTNHAAGVSWLTRFAGKFSKPGSTKLRYSRTGICSLRQVSTIEIIAATTSSAIISIVETCRRLSLPVRDYLASVRPGLADFPINRVAELTPTAWAVRN